MDPRDLLDRLARSQLANIRFADTQRLMEALGFELDRIRGSHYIYRHAAIHQRINLQPQSGQAKPYQLRQILEVIKRYDLRLEAEQ